MGFDQLQGAISESVAVIPRNPDQLGFADEGWDDETALGIVLNDVDQAEKYLLGKNLISFLDMADDLVRAFVKPRIWPGTDVPRANLGMFVALEAMERILPTLHLSLFGTRKYPFVVEPKGKTKPDAARANEHLLGWAVKQCGFREQIRLALKTALQYGLIIGNYSWEQREQLVKEYHMQEGKVVAKRGWEDINQPDFEALDMRRILVDPACSVQNLRDERRGAKYVIKQVYVTANGLDDLRDDDTYTNVPTRDELRTILAHDDEITTDSLKASQTNAFRDLQAELKDQPTSADPLQKPLELLEYWTKDRVITVLQRKIVIRNEENEFGKLPFVSCSFIDVLGSLWGFGIPRLISAEQRLQNGVVNTWVDSLSLVLNPAWQLLKGLGPAAQQVRISPGKIITESGELKPLVVPSISTEAMNAISMSEQRASRRVGANGGSAMPNPAMRTAEGVSAFAGDVTQRLQYFLEQFIDLVYIPTLEAFLDMMHDHLQPKQINDILTDAEGQAYNGDILDVYRASCKVDVIAGTKLTAREAAAQLIPMIIQLASSAPVQDSFVMQGKKLNYTELITQGVNLLGWDVDLVEDMTAEDKQRADEMNPAKQKAQADAQAQAQQHQNEIELINEKGTVQAGVALVKNTAKSHMEAAQTELENLSGQQ